jgi:hypothetical protein
MRAVGIKDSEVQAFAYNSKDQMSDFGSDHSSEEDEGFGKAMTTRLIDLTDAADAPNADVVGAKRMRESPGEEPSAKRSKGEPASFADGETPDALFTVTVASHDLHNRLRGTRRVGKEAAGYQLLDTAGLEAACSIGGGDWAMFLAAEPHMPIIQRTMRFAENVESTYNINRNPSEGGGRARLGPFRLGPPKWCEGVRTFRLDGWMPVVWVINGA